MRAINSVLVITKISGYCIVHIYWHNNKLYRGLILVRVDYKPKSACVLLIFIET